MKKRQAFNFYESYYLVALELDNPQDRLDYLMAILSRQFEGIEPTEISKMAMFAYKSQKHSIDKQVQGWEDKTGISLTPYQDPTEPPTEDPYVPPTEGSSEGSIEPPYEPPYEPPLYNAPMTTEGPSQGPSEGPREQEQEQGQEKEKEKEQLEIKMKNEEFGKLNHKDKYKYLKLIKSGVKLFVDDELCRIKDYCLIQEIPYDEEENELDKQMNSIFN